MNSASRKKIIKSWAIKFASFPWWRENLNWLKTESKSRKGFSKEKGEKTIEIEEIMQNYNHDKWCIGKNAWWNQTFESSNQSNNFHHQNSFNYLPVLFDPMTVTISLAFNRESLSKISGRGASRSNPGLWDLYKKSTKFSKWDSQSFNKMDIPLKKSPKHSNT